MMGPPPSPASSPPPPSPTTPHSPTRRAPSATARARHDATRGRLGQLPLLSPRPCPLRRSSITHPSAPPPPSLPLELATRSSVCLCTCRSTTLFAPFLQALLQEIQEVQEKSIFPELQLSNGGNPGASA